MQSNMYMISGEYGTCSVESSKWKKSEWDKNQKILTEEV